MKNSVLGTNVVTQIAIIVEDIEKTSQAYADFLGVEKPNVIITDTVDKAQTEYRGESSQARAKLAFFDVGGNLQLELIEPDEHPSTWREFLDEHGEGVHHIAFVVEDMKGTVKKLEANGMPLIQKGEYDGGRYSYVETTDELKVLLELLEND
ncbi:VOC family protein [Aquibacillus albus]|uniref:4-hydroxyphenylpyruvate dioxygenase-like putative hemolysin n=1 Tax=Aquibacillus albus TaxID=1168171 RepID=A0ABS2MVP7_9BACI|nr:VOC family protein [Aquibacillus albus]MBM7569979.1 4-hydroxyphenylpyruvate dioxygenase-like putative hemolysin [Aquibacillus albus]